ncbi:MAG TPA: ABC transporter permease [Longimicrobiales bacterium]
MDTVYQELRYAYRALRRSPGFTLVAVLTLALGTGANTAIFSAVNAVLLRPLPYPEPDRVVRVFDTFDGRPATLSPPNFYDYREQARSFEAIGAYYGTSYALTGEGPAAQIQAARASAGVFEALGIRPALGRTFGPAEEVVGSDRVVVLGHGLWQRRFGGDPAVIGRAIRLDGESYAVVGVMPPGFDYPRGTELWLPLAFTADDLATQRGAHYLSAVARLRPEATVEQAREEVAAVARRLAVDHPDTNERVGATVVSLHEAMVGDVRPALLILLGAVGFVLLIACANVANLLLARAVGRARELAVRAALGAGRRRLLRQLVVESVALAAVGGACGALFAVWGQAVLMRLQPGGIPRLAEATVDGTVLGFAVVVSLGTGLLFGLLPAVHATRRLDLSAAMKEGGRGGIGTRGGWRARTALIASEVALAVLLLVGAGLMIKSFARLTDVDPGFDPEGVLTFDLSLPGAEYATAERSAAFYRTLLQRIEALPGVETAGGTMILPMSGSDYSISVEALDGAELGDDRDHSVQVRVVTPGYFRTLRIPLLRGRDFTERDRAGAPKAVVLNEAAAKMLWPDGDALGRTLELGTTMGFRRGRIGGEVVGVVADVKGRGPAEPAWPAAYFPHDQVPIRSLSLAVRTPGDPNRLIRPIRGLVAELDPDVPMYGEQPMTRLVDRSVAEARFYMTLLAVFATVALTLAAIGIYGVMAHLVRHRTREIGIRIALGAHRTDVLRMVFRQAMAVALAGLAIGLAAAAALSRTLSGLLFELSPTDPPTYGAVAVVLAGVAALATFLPARRAASVDPVEALRDE